MKPALGRFGRPTLVVSAAFGLLATLFLATGFGGGSELAAAATPVASPYPDLAGQVEVTDSSSTGYNIWRDDDGVHLPHARSGPAA